MSELTCDEFYDVYRVFRPDATREEYEVEWETFQHAKAAHQADKRRQ